MRRLIAKAAFALLAALLLPMATPSYAQQGTLTGTVTDAESGESLPGANVLISEADMGAATNADGEYTIEGVPAGEYTVQVTFVGYKTLESDVMVTPGETVTQDFQLQIASTKLEDVVVTAQGIKRQARELGYSVSEIESEDLKTGKETNFVKSLSGKVPGLNVTSQSGDVGGSARIILRGIASLDGDNQPLFVVNGVPISNAQIGSAGAGRLSGTYDTGNQASDIDPNNVQSVSILKGGAAAARYGSRAKNGAIIITTKKGSSQTRSSVAVTSSLLATRPLRLPDLQNKYAGGDVGKFNKFFLNGWGPRIDGQEVVNFRGRREPLTVHEDNVSNFYNTGLLATNSVSFSNAGDFGDFRLGVTRTDQGGIVPESSLDKTNLSLNAGTSLDNGFRARVSGQYVNENTVGKVASGGNDPNTLVGIVNSFPRTLDLNDIKDYFDDAGDQIPLGGMTNNPYFIANENAYTTGEEHVLGRAEAGYSPLDWLEFTARAGIDYYTQDRQQTNVKGTLGAKNGAFTTRTVQERQIDADLIAQADRSISKDFSLNAILGANVNDRTREIDDNSAVQLTVENLFRPSNAENNSPAAFFSDQRILGAYGDVTLGFRDYAFLEVTGRNDWSSTLPDDNNSYFYPSANLSLILTDILRQEADVESSILSYAKLRANYSQVGSDTGPYQLQFAYSGLGSVFGQYGADVIFPYFGRTAFGGPGTIPPLDLKPERQKGYELGTELRFFSGRITFDFTYYNQRTDDQILAVPIPQATGFARRRTNVGEVKNTGIELVLNGGIIATPAFTWRTNINFSKNDNTVVSLAEGLDQLTLQSGFNSYQVRVEPGKSFGIYGTGFARDPETGLPIIDPDTGLRQSGEDQRLADLYPDFTMGIGNTFNLFGDLELGFLIDWRQGGSLFSSTVGGLRASGLAEETLDNRGGTFIDEGVIVERNADGDIVDRRPNDVPVESMEAFWNQYNSQNILEGQIFDASYVKLREASITYNLPTHLLERTPFGAASIKLEGRNLALLYAKVPHIDPETNLFGSGASIGQGYEFNNLPSTRSFGATINLKF